MKKFRKLTSAVCSLAMVLSMAVIPNTANAELTEKSILDLTFDTEAVKIVAADTNNAVTATWQEGGYAVVKDTNPWSYGSIVFDEAMGAGDYSISFDFAFTASGGGYGSIYLTDEAHNGGSQYKAFGLLTDSATEAKVGSYGSYVAASGLSYTRGNWYNYDMDVNTATGTYTVTITDLENAENKGTVTGSNLPTTLSYDRIMFGTGVEVALDNVKVNGWVDEALYLDVMSEDKSTANSYLSFGTTYCNDGEASKYQAHFNDYTGNLSTGGWPLVKSISGADAKTYEVKFDFNVATAAFYTTAMLGLAGETFAGWSSSPATYNSGYKFWQISEVVDGGYKFNWGDATYATSTWYSMTTYISPETGYERKIIAEKETGATIADTGWVALDSSATGWIISNTYDKLRFTANKAIMNIDNASVYAVDFPIPSVKAVTALADGVAQEYADTHTNGFEIRFTQAMDDATVEAIGVVTITDEANNVIGFTFGDWSEDKKAVTLNLAKALEDNKIYTVTVTTEAKDTDGEALMKDATVELSVDNTILDADIDNTNPTPYQHFTNGRPYWYTEGTEENGNKFMNLKGVGNYQNGWGGGEYGDAGYMFSRPMREEDDYTIDFDFRINAFGASENYDGLVITNYNYTQAAWAERESLIFGSIEAPKSDLGEFTGNINWTAGKWYSYHAELTDGNKWTVKITDKEDIAQAVAVSGEYAYDTMDRIAVVAGADFDLDNIKIETKGAEIPKVLSVAFDEAKPPKFLFGIQEVMPLSILAQNTTDTEADGLFMICYYDNDGRLISVCTTPFTVPVETNGSVNITVVNDTAVGATANSIKLMMVNSYAGFTPYCPAQEITE